MDSNSHYSFRIHVDGGNKPDAGIGPNHGGPTSSHVDAKAAFYKDVELAEEDIKKLDTLYDSLLESHEQMKEARDSTVAGDLRARISRELEKIIKMAKQISKKLGGLVLTSGGLRMLPGSEPGSEEDKARYAAIYGLEELVYQLMRHFQGMRAQVEAEQRQVIQNRFFSIAGQRATEENIEKLISNSVPEIALRQAVEELGREVVVDTIAEIKERRDSMIEMRSVMMNLHQILLGIAGPVEARKRPTSPREASRLIPTPQPKPIEPQVHDDEAPPPVFFEDDDDSKFKRGFRLVVGRLIELCRLTDSDKRVMKTKANFLLFMAEISMLTIIILTLIRDTDDE